MKILILIFSIMIAFQPLAYSEAAKKKKDGKKKYLPQHVLSIIKRRIRNAKKLATM